MVNVFESGTTILSHLPIIFLRVKNDCSDIKEFFFKLSKNFEEIFNTIPI